MPDDPAPLIANLRLDAVEHDGRGWYWRARTCRAAADLLEQQHATIDGLMKDLAVIGDRLEKVGGTVDDIAAMRAVRDRIDAAREARIATLEAALRERHAFEKHQAESWQAELDEAYDAIRRLIAESPCDGLGRFHPQSCAVCHAKAILPEANDG